MRKEEKLFSMCAVLVWLILLPMVCGCGPKSQPVTAETSDIKIETGDNSPVFVNQNQLRDHHETHFTSIKMGIGAILIFLLAVDFWLTWKKCRSLNARRIDRRAGSLMVKRFDARDREAQPERAQSTI